MIIELDTRRASWRRLEDGWRDMQRKYGEPPDA